MPIPGAGGMTGSTPASSYPVKKPPAKGSGSSFTSGKGPNGSMKAGSTAKGKPPAKAPSSSSNPFDYKGEKINFSKGKGKEMWRTDGKGGAKRLDNPASSNPHDYSTPMNYSKNGKDLWRTDGRGGERPIRR